MSTGLAMFALAWAVELWWGTESSRDSDGSVATPRLGINGLDVPILSIGGAEWMAALGHLAAVLAFAVSLMLLPTPPVSEVARRRSREAQVALAAAAAVWLLGVVAAPVAAGVDGIQVIQVWKSTWPIFLVTVAAFTACVVAARHAERSWLVPMGAVLLEAWAMLSLYQFIEDWVTWSSWWNLTRAGHAVVSTTGRAESLGVLDVVAGLAAACALGGAALLVAGTLRASRGGVTH